MAIDKKISELSNGAPAQASDEYVVARGAANYKLTLTNLAASMPPIGATTPNTGAFTTLSATGNVGFDGGTFTFNESGADKDFRVEGDTDANLIFSDASTDRVGIGTSTPATKLDVNGTITATAVNTTTLDLTNLEVTNIKAKDGTAAMSIADSSGIVSVTANPVLSAGTANGVTYLNGSKVLTSGSALTFDGTTVSSPVVQSTNGTITSVLSYSVGNSTGVIGTTSNHALEFRQNNAEGMRLTSTGLGIGTSSPVGKLDVVGSSSRVRWDLSNAYVYQAATNTAASAFAAAYYDGSQHLWLTSSSTRMTLDSSGNLGLGVTPSAWGSIFKAIQGTGGGAIAFRTDAANVDMFSNAYYNGTNFIYQKTGYSALRYRMEDGGTHAWFNAPSGTAGNTITFTTAMVLDASGNLGVGTSSPTAGFRLDVQAADAKWRLQSTTGTNSVQSRLINTGGTFYTAIDDSGGNIFGTAYAGVLWHSGNYPVVFATNNTERARITAGGALLVNTTAVTYSSERLAVISAANSNAAAFKNDGGGAGANAYTVAISNTASSGDNAFVVFATETSDTTRGSITYNRGAGQVAYNVTSDVRLKDNIADAFDAGDKIDAMQVRQFDWKETGNHLDYGFVAQELHEVAPHAVSKPEDDETMWSVDYSKLVPMLVKEIQSLRARVAALEA